MRCAEHDRGSKSPLSPSSGPQAVVAGELVEEGENAPARRRAGARTSGRRAECRHRALLQAALQPGNRHAAFPLFGAELTWTSTTRACRPCPSPSPARQRARPIERVIARTGHRLVRLVRLELAHEMQLDVGIAFAQRRPLGLSLLDRFSPNTRCPDSIRGRSLRRDGFADRYQRYLDALAPRDLTHARCFPRPPRAGCLRFSCGAL